MTDYLELNFPGLGFRSQLLSFMSQRQTHWTTVQSLSKVIQELLHLRTARLEGKILKKRDEKEGKNDELSSPKSIYLTPLTGFSISFKVDHYDVNVGGLVATCCRQFQAFIHSLYSISSKSRRLKPSSSRCFSQLPALNENPGFDMFTVYLLAMSTINEN